MSINLNKYHTQLAFETNCCATVSHRICVIRNTPSLTAIFFLSALSVAVKVIEPNATKSINKNLFEVEMKYVNVFHLLLNSKKEKITERTLKRSKSNQIKKIFHLHTFRLSF